MRAFRHAIFLSLSLLLGVSALGRGKAHRADLQAANQASVGQIAAPQNLNFDSGWRRTDEGWLQTADWTVSSSRTEQTFATQLHPSLVAAFVFLVSAGALLAFDPAIRRPRQPPLKSDQRLIQDWARQMRQQASADNTDCL